MAIRHDRDSRSFQEAGVYDLIFSILRQFNPTGDKILTKSQKIEIGGVRERQRGIIWCRSQMDRAMDCNSMITGSNPVGIFDNGIEMVTIMELYSFSAVEKRKISLKII